ncbi:efflux RND transporter periplasmic adaptor subunit [Plesiocystis pacifica]|nr:efflux RND transporter periplasmic adaptor subunit [Plesiocystis pacifica]
MPESAHPMHRRSRSTLVALLAVALACACSTTDDQAPTPEPERDDAPLGVARVRVAPVERCRVDASARIHGQIEDRSELSLAFALPGRVRSLEVEVGATVEAGQLLARLDDQDLRARAAAASSGRELAEEGREQAARELERSELLASRRSLGAATAERTASSLRQAEAQVELARSEARAARSMLRHGRLEAPVAGVVAELHTRRGEVVGAGQPILRIEPSEPRRTVRARVPEHLLGRFEVGARVHGRSLGTDRPFVAVVRRVGAVRRGPGYVQELVADLEPSPEGVGAFPLGVSVELEVPPAKGDDGPDSPDSPNEGLCVPLGAISYAAPGRTGAFVLGSEGTVHFRELELGASDGRHVIARAGLEPGERVVAQGLDSLREGSRVAVVEGPAS